jgi:hypothetical protein
MEETVASIPIDSVEAIREKATASASLSNTPGEVTEEMQVIYQYLWTMVVTIETEST